jgi:hypothetical protein
MKGSLVRKSLLSVLLMLLLCGCGEAAVTETDDTSAAAQAGTAAVEPGTDTTEELTPGVADTAGGGPFNVGEMPLSSRLSVGTLMLEDTEYAVTPEQAEELLPLWQMLRTSQESGTASEAESEAILEQIQDVMTAEQLAAIEEMGQEDIAELMQDIGTARGPREPGEDGGGGPVGEGGMPTAEAGGMPPGGEMPPGGAEGTPMGGMPPGGGPGEAEGTPMARGMGFGPSFIEQVIELLEMRAAEA